MSSVSFSGLATGLDTGSIISQLVELKRAPIYRLQKDKKSYQDQISSLATLKTKLLALQTAARKLDTANTSWNSTRDFLKPVVAEFDTLLPMTLSSFSAALRPLIA